MKRFGGYRYEATINRNGKKAGFCTKKLGFVPNWLDPYQMKKKSVFLEKYSDTTHNPCDRSAMVANRLPMDNK